MSDRGYWFDRPNPEDFEREIQRRDKGLTEARAAIENGTRLLVKSLKFRRPRSEIVELASKVSNAYSWIARNFSNDGRSPSSEAAFKFALLRDRLYNDYSQGITDWNLSFLVEAVEESL